MLKRYTKVSFFYVIILLDGENMKRIFNILFTCSIVFLITIITIRFNIVEKSFNVFLKNKINDILIIEIDETLSFLDVETKNIVLDKTKNNPEIQKIVDIFYENMLNDLFNNTITRIDVSNEINKLINDNLNHVPSGYLKIFENIITNIDFNDIYFDTLSLVKTKLDTKFINIISIYIKFASDSVISLLSIVIILCLFVIIYSNKSIINTLNDIGISLFIDGLIMMIILFFLNKLEVVIEMLTAINIDLKIYMVLTFSFIIIGFILKDIKIKKRS